MAAREWTPTTDVVRGILHSMKQECSPIHANNAKVVEQYIAKLEKRREMNAREFLTAHGYLTPEPWLEVLLDQFVADKVEEIAGGLVVAASAFCGARGGTVTNENRVQLLDSLEAALAAYHEAVGR